MHHIRYTTWAQTTQLQSPFVSMRSNELPQSRTGRMKSEARRAFDASQPASVGLSTLVWTHVGFTLSSTLHFLRSPLVVIYKGGFLLPDRNITTKFCFNCWKFSEIFVLPVQRWYIHISIRCDRTRDEFISWLNQTRFLTQASVDKGWQQMLFRRCEWGQNAGSN